MPVDVRLEMIILDSLFIFRLTSSFIIAGSWIAFATLWAEKLGSKIGGLISNLPSNILISFIFIAIINGIPFTVESIPGIPIGMAINSLFLFVFVISLKYGIVISTVISLTSWFLLAYIAASLSFEDFVLNTVLYIFITLSTFIFLEKIAKICSVNNTKKNYTVKQIISRAVFAGSVVASVIILAQFLPPFAVGIFATFPAVLLSTMIILVVNQSREFAQATGKILILSSSNIVIYGIGVYFTYPVLGIFMGTPLSFLLAALWVGLMRPLVRRLA